METHRRVGRLLDRWCCRRVPPHLSERDMLIPNQRPSFFNSTSGLSSAQEMTNEQCHTETPLRICCPVPPEETGVLCQISCLQQYSHLALEWDKLRPQLHPAAPQKTGRCQDRRRRLPCAGQPARGPFSRAASSPGTKSRAVGSDHMARRRREFRARPRVSIKLSTVSSKTVGRGPPRSSNARSPASQN